MGVARKLQRIGLSCKEVAAIQIKLHRFTLELQGSCSCCTKVATPSFRVAEIAVLVARKLQLKIQKKLSLMASKIPKKKQTIIKLKRRIIAVKEDANRFLEY